MAKEQSLSLNPTKISGSCGRLMCCLNYEQESYEYLNSITPQIGATVKTEQGVGIVTDVNFITGNLTVKPKDTEGVPYKTNRKYVKVLSGHKQKKIAEEKD
jgi:cell fate regulator YaaT (PSP1 superfamily)